MAQVICRVPDDVEKSFREMCEARKITRQAAVVGMLQWITRQDGYLQAMVMGQVPESLGLLELIQSRME